MNVTVKYIAEENKRSWSPGEWRVMRELEGTTTCEYIAQASRDECEIIAAALNCALATGTLSRTI